ncbi:MAG: DNA repair protein RecO [Tepidiformaceae bacterium]
MSDRPRVYKTEGIILRRRNIGEADSIFTVFSERDGKFDAVARGVRKARSRMRGHLEPLTRSRLMLARGRTLDVFTQAETVDPYHTLRDDVDRGAAGLYCAELIDRFTIDHAENSGLYHLLRQMLESIDAGLPLQVIRHFELELLRLAGYEVQLLVCTLCGNRLPPEDALLSATAGGLVCGSCRPAAGEGRILSVGAIKVLRHARTVDVTEFATLRLDGALGAELQAALGRVLRYHLDRDLNTPRFAHEMASFRH